jgi:hypothetical protein
VRCSSLRFHADLPEMSESSYTLLVRRWHSSSNRRQADDAYPQEFQEVGFECRLRMIL